MKLNDLFFVLVLVGSIALRCLEKRLPHKKAEVITGRVRWVQRGSCKGASTAHRDGKAMYLEARDLARLLCVAGESI